MKPIPFYQAQTLVALYNEHRDARIVSKKIKLPRELVVKIISWLWGVENSRELDLGMKHSQSVLPPLTKQRWANYLYANNATVPHAAESLDWSLHDVLHSCGGPLQWMLPCNRKPVLEEAVIADEGEGPEEDDPTPAEILARAAEVQARWTPSQRAAADVRKPARRVEVTQWPDDRT